METKEKRLERLQNGPPREALLTVIQSLWNCFVETDIKPASENNMVYLTMFGIHAVAETWAEILFNTKSIKGFKRYLEFYVDDNMADRKFSHIAEILNEKRNVIAHQWLSSQGHRFGFDSNMQQGWSKRDSVTYINPRIYFECFYRNFPTWEKIRSKFNNDEIEIMRGRIVDKYLKW